jgi:hypothetical protein
MDYSMWDEFEWIPDGLLRKWIVGVKGLHERDGWGSMPGIMWDRDTMTFAGCHKGTMEMLRGATKGWRPSKRREYGTYLISLVLAIECLGCDFTGWGTAHPDAKRQADEILDQFFVHNRTRLLDVYMPLRAQLDQGELRRTFGPE